MNYKIILENHVFTTLEDFGKNIYLYPDASEKLLTSTKFLSFLSKENRALFDQLIQINHKVRDANAFLFYVQYLFCPHMELKHHGYCFSTLKELGEKIIGFGPSIDVYLKDFLKFKLLSKYMVDQGINLQKPQIYTRVLELEKLFLTNENKAYFLLGFALSECDTIVYDKERYSDVKEFLTTMITDYYISKSSYSLEQSQYIYAWLEVKGFKRQVDEYRSLVETIEQMEIKL